MSNPPGGGGSPSDLKDRSHFLSIGSAEGKKEQMLDLEAEKEFGTHIWSFDSTHEYFDS